MSLHQELEREKDEPNHDGEHGERPTKAIYLTCGFSHFGQIDGQE
jgi:hypothetical protein